jgi:hypothetical protein
MDQVTVGRIVHYAHNGFETGQKTLAGIVTHVHDDGSVNLTVFHNTFEEHLRAVSYDPGEGSVSDVSAGWTYPDGTWHWPARV